MIQITLTGDQSILDSGLDSFCKYNGWKEQVDNPNYVEGGQEPEFIPNPVTNLIFAAEILRQYFRETIISYNARIAQEQAIAATRTATESALDTTSLQVSQS